MRFETILDSLKIRFLKRCRPARHSGQTNKACDRQHSTSSEAANKPMQKKLQAAKNNFTRLFKYLGLVDTSFSNSTAFRLLDLPYDIRVLIYSYLIPHIKDRFIDGAPTYQHSWSRNQRTEPCRPSLRYPTIALTSRQLYKEVLPLWYGSEYYPASINLSGFHFLGVDNSFITLRCLQHIRNLELTMSLFLPSRPTFHHNPIPINIPRSAQVTTGLDRYDLFIKECFKAGTQLRRLTLKMDATRVEFDCYVGRLGELRKDLARELASFRKVRGLVDLEAMFTISAEGEDLPSDEMLGVIYEFMEGLKVDMTSPFTNKEAKE